MRILYLLVALFLFFAALPSEERKVVVSGQTWNGPGGEKNNPPIVMVIETDESGRITGVYRDKKTDLGIHAVYAQNSCQFSFAYDWSKVTSEVSISWNGDINGPNVINYQRDNDIPERNLLGKKYPRQTIKEFVTIDLKSSSSSEYSWFESGRPSTSDGHGNSIYQAIFGKRVLWDSHDTQGDPYRIILDGSTSDASEQPRVKMLYTKTPDGYKGTQYWVYEPSRFDASKWFKGGAIKYQGPSLTTAEPLINVVNYYILASFLNRDDAWSYFGPSLFGIPIR